MQFIAIDKIDGITTLTLKRGKVNALNQVVIDELIETLKSLLADPETKAIILTGRGKFFSFGFDIPEFLSYTKDEFTGYLTNFTGLYTYIFSYPKPVVAALNGHAIAGGCMLALACDHRIMTTGKARISLNEINFGASVFAGCMQMLQFWIGGKNATKVLYSGSMYSAEEAKTIGMVEDVTTKAELIILATRVAKEFGLKHLPAFTSIKLQLRKPVIDHINCWETESIKEFTDIWYSKVTWANLKNIKIY